MIAGYIIVGIWCAAGLFCIGFIICKIPRKNGGTLYCKHKWEFVEKVTLADWTTLAHMGFYPIPEERYKYVCEKCGKEKLAKRERRE